MQDHTGHTTDDTMVAGHTLGNEMNEYSLMWLQILGSLLLVLMVLFNRELWRRYVALTVKRDEALREMMRDVIARQTKELQEMIDKAKDES